MEKEEKEVQAEKVCSSCGQVVTEYHNEDFSYCSECFKNNVFKCSHCKEHFERDRENLQRINRKNYCEECFEELFFECDDCGNVHLNDDSISINDGNRIVCQTCYENDYLVCDSCECDIHRDNDHYHYNNDHCLCENCLEEYFTCSRCGDLYHDDQSYYCESCHRSYCEDCYNDHGCIEHLHNYDYTPNRMTFHSISQKKATDLFLGWELEIEKIDNVPDLVYELYNLSENEKYFYLKTDGSLSDLGIEICSQPCTLDFFVNKFPLQKLVEICRDYNAVSHNSGNCGFHIHVNRQYFSNYELSATKICLIFEKLWQHLFLFSKRNNLNYCHKNEDLGKLNKKLVTGIKEKNVKQGRYQSVNLIPISTIEFRLWRGTLKINSLIGFMQLTNLIAIIAENDSIMSIQKMNWQNVLEMARKLKYKQFLQACIEKGI
ncbi:MAG: hypothetical protein GY853_01615 [PVC group bacterium]|nr:hypothetical protein [PVC group bacterium]